MYDIFISTATAAEKLYKEVFMIKIIYFCMVEIIFIFEFFLIQKIGKIKNFSILEKLKNMFIINIFIFPLIYFLFSA